ncbi:MAG: hypothetical protein WD066_20220 [Planctomycetaceae bacterium]
MTLPIGPADADREVRITIEPATEPSTPSAEEWRKGILETAGKWQGDFERQKFHVGSPRLAQQERAGEFAKEVVEEPLDAGL